MAVPPAHFPENGLQTSKTRTIIKEESGSSSSIDELFSTVRNKNSVAKPLKDRKLPPSFFHPNAQQSPKNGTYHSRDSSSDSTTGVCSPPLQMKNSFNESTVCSNDNANLMLQYISSSHHIAHSRAHSSPATLQASLHQKGNSASVSADMCSPVNTASTNMPMICHERFLSYDNTNTYFNTEDPILHQRMQSSPTPQTNHLCPFAPSHVSAQQPHDQIHDVQQNGNQQTPGNQEIDRFPQSVSHLDQAQMGQLPDGWEMAVSDAQHVYFIDHHNKSTQWTDPRIPSNLQHPCGYTLAQLQEVHNRYRAFLQEEQLLELSRQKESLRTRIEEVLTKESRLRHELSQCGHSDQLLVMSSNTAHMRQESSDSGLAAEPILTPPVVDMNCTSLSLSPDLQVGSTFDSDELYPSLQESLQTTNDEWLMSQDFSGF